MTTTLEVLSSSPATGVAIHADALIARHEALTAAATIQSVTSPEESALAVAAQAQLTQLLRDTKKQRLELTRPMDEAKKLVMDTASAFLEPLLVEELRLARLIGDYTQAALARERSAQNSRNATLTELEREREIALSREGLTGADHERIHEEFDARIRAVPGVEVSRAPGQVVRQEWDVVVQDVHALYRSHPQCVKLTPLLGEVKALLDEGVVVRGVRAERVTKSGVRT